MLRSLLLLACPVALLAQTPAPAANPTPAAAAPTPVAEVLAVPEPGRFKVLFQPFRTDNAALSPDGKYLAYSLREKGSVSVAVVEIDHPEKLTAFLKVVDDDAATPMLEMEQSEPTPGTIRWMGWVTPTRLVVETNQIFSQPNSQGTWQGWRGAIYGINADGTGGRLLAKPDDLPEFADDPGFPSTSARSRSATPGPSQPAGQTSAANDLGDLAMRDFFGEAAEEDQAPTTPGATQGRSLRVFDYDPTKPGAVRLSSFGASKATGSRGVGFHSLDVLTGKLTDLTDELVAPNELPLMDRQGRARLTIPNTTLASFPFRYAYYGPKGRNRGKPLDDVTGLRGFTVAPENFFGERSVPLGFDENPDILYYASNVGRDTYGVYSLNLSTKERGKVTIENPAFDLIGPPTSGFAGRETLVFDRYTHQLAGVRFESVVRSTAWLRPDLQELQARFERTFPGRCVTILDWDQSVSRYLVSTEGAADPGAYYVYDRKTDKLSEFVRRAPWVEEKHIHTTLSFEFATADGARITGLVTIPRQPRLRPIPMLVVCPDLPWLRVRSEFQSEVQALAGMGFAVVQLNGRGAWGLGMKQRQTLTNGYDLVQVADLVATVDGLGKTFNVNLKRVALFGRGHGGFIALRALQEHPEMFRCAVAIEAPVNLGDWLEEQRWTTGEAQPQLTRAWLGDAARLKAAPLVRAPERITKPILLLNYPGPKGGDRRTAFVAARGFATDVKRQGGDVTFGDLSTDYLRGLPSARAAVFDQVEQFLNTNIYDFKVKLQEMQVIK